MRATGAVRSAVLAGAGLELAVCGATAVRPELRGGCAGVLSHPRTAPGGL